MNRLALAVSTFFGCGFSPVGPGTVGSLAAVLVAMGLGSLGYGRGALTIAVILLFPLGVWAATRTERLLGREDPGQVVVDEVLGQWIALLGASFWNWKAYVAAFVLFRVFDIWKPQPVRMAESLPKGLGIVADDIVAGIYAALILVIGARLRII